MTLGYSLGGYLEPVTPFLAMSSHCYQLRRHAASRHFVGNDPRVLSKGLPRVGHATTIYIDTLALLTSSAMRLEYSSRNKKGEFVKSTI